MTTASIPYLTVELAGVFAFALNGALTALRLTRLDIVGVVVLGTLTAIGGGMLRDVLLGATPPATFSDWRYLAVAGSGALVAFLFGRGLDRLTTPILWLDAAGLSLFAVSGALRSLDLGAGPAQAVILGVVTAAGGGTLRDVLIREVPTVLTSGLYAIPALLGSFLIVLAERLDAPLLPSAVVAAGACFALRMLGVHLDLHAPGPRGPRHPELPGDDQDGASDR